MCTKHLDRFINDFPELKERCIDSVYDACEDPVSDVQLLALTGTVNLNLRRQ